jgi:hypothetical protein
MSYNENPLKILQKSLQERGFIGGDSEEYVIRQNDLEKENQEISNHEYVELEEDDFLESLEDWKGYIEGIYNIDSQGMTPLQMKEYYESMINEYRMDLVDLKNSPDIHALSQEEQNKKYEKIAEQIQSAQLILQNIENYLMTHKKF